MIPPFPGMYLHSIYSRTREWVVRVEEVVSKSGAGKATCEGLEGSLVVLPRRELVRRKVEATLVKCWVDDAVISATTVDGVGCNEGEGGQRLLGILGSVNGMTL